MKRFFMILTTILLCSSYLQAQNEACTTAMNDGINYYNLGEYTNAKKTFEAAKRINCTDAQLWINKCNTEINKLKEDYSKPPVSSELDQSECKQSLQKGFEMYDNKKYEEAKTFFTTARDLGCLEANNWIDKIIEQEKRMQSENAMSEGEFYYNRQQYDMALTYFEIAAKNKYFGADVWVQRCKTHIANTTTLSVSKENLSFTSAGGKSEQITVYSNAGTYSVTSLPSWCSVQTYSGYFVITCNTNTETTSRNGYSMVAAGDKNVRVNISQSGATPKQPETTLRKATTAELTDIWNNKYGVTSQRRQNLINAGIDPDDAQMRVNKGEGKPVPVPITLTTSKQNISFTTSGGIATIDVKTNASDYKILDLPSWCTISSKYDTWFSIRCNANNSNQSRMGWFKVLADGKEVKIMVSQVGTKVKKCFNCPKGNISSWGMNFGYAETNYEYSNTYTQPGFQVGLRYEPLFKYGFGLNFGLNFEYYNYDYDEYSDNNYYSYEIAESALNFNAGLEYRLNFSKWFNVYVYGGVSFDYSLSLDAIYNGETYNLYDNADDDPMRFFKYVDFGAGFRINHLQFNITRSILWDNFEYEYDFNNYFYNPRKLVLSISYMF